MSPMVSAKPVKPLSGKQGAESEANDKDLSNVFGIAFPRSQASTRQSISGPVSNDHWAENISDHWPTM